MRQRAYDRLAAVVSISLLAVLAAVSYYLAEWSDRFRLPRLSGEVRHEPDYIVEGIALTSMNKLGQPVFRMTAARLEHFPDDDTNAFVRPQLVSLDPAKPRVSLVAARGRATGQGERIELFDAVRLTRAAEGERPELTVDTDYVVLVPDEDVARTDRPVHIRYGASSLTGVGMEFNNAARVLQVRSQVRGVWTATPRP